MKLTKKLGLYLCLVLLFVTLLTPLVTNHIPKASAAVTGDALKAKIATDLTRRRLFFLRECVSSYSANQLTASVINIGRTVRQGSDLFNNAVVTYPHTAVGIDITPLGVDSCVERIREGLNAAYGNGTIPTGGSQQDDINNEGLWLLNYLTNGNGLSNTNLGPFNPTASWATRMQSLIAEIDAKYNPIATPDDTMIAKRVMPLISACYTFSATPTHTPNTGAGDIVLPNNGGYLYAEFSPVPGLESPPRVKTLAKTFVTHANDGNGPGGTLTGTEYGKIEMDWNIGDNVSPKWEQQFFPFGKDRDLGGAPETWGVVGCPFILKNQAKIFADLKVATDGTLVHLDNTPLDPAESIGTDGSGDNGSATLGHVDCTWSLNPLTWALCPLLDLTQKVIGWFDGVIQSELELDTCNFDTSGRPPCGASASATAYHQAWNAFRLLAVSLLLMIALVMTISQAISIGPFDAYTIRRVMPRLVIAVILITLSWPLMRLAVELSNALGIGVRQLIYKPFSAAPFRNPNLSGGTLTAGIIGGGAIGGVLGVMGVLSFAGTAAMALLVGFAVVVMRQILVTLLAIIAPIGILCFILPNTQRFWKLWHENFSRALIAFPIISAFIAVGTVFARVSSVGTPDTVHQIFAFAGIYAPFFLLPLAFRLAGGAIANISGFAKNKSGGAHGRLKKFRAKEAKERYGKFKAGEMGGERTRKVGLGLGTFAEMERGTKRKFLSRAGRTEALATQGVINKNRQAQSERARATKDNDGANRALVAGLTEAEARQNIRVMFPAMDEGQIERAFQAAAANGGWSAQRQQVAFASLTASGTGWDNIDQVTEAANRVSGGNESTLSALLGEHNSVTKSVGRHALAPGFGNLLNAAHQASAREQTAGQLGVDANGIELDQSLGARRERAAQNARTRAIGNGATVAQAEAMATEARVNTRQLTQDESRTLYTQSARDIDASTLARDKRIDVDHMTNALAQTIDIAHNNASNVTLPADQRDAAKAERDQLSGFVEKIAQSGFYSSTNNTEAAGANLVSPTRVIRQEVAASASPVQMTVNPVTQRQETVYLRDPGTGALIPDADGRPQVIPNLTQDTDTAETYGRHSVGRPGDPNDPRNQP